MDTQNPEAASENPGAQNPGAQNPEAAQEPTPVIVPIAAVRMGKAPNREQRNALFVELGTLNPPEGTVRLYANRRNGSLMAVMPDGQAFGIDTGVFGSQCYKYWKLHPEFNPVAEEEDNEDNTPSTPDPLTLQEAADLIPRTLFDAQGNPIAKS